MSVQLSKWKWSIADVLLAGGLVLQAGLLFLLYRKYREECEKNGKEISGQRNDLNVLKLKLRSLEHRLNDAQQRTVTFAPTTTTIGPEAPAFEPLSRVASVASSEFVDALEDWPQTSAVHDDSPADFSTFDVDELKSKEEVESCFDKLKVELEKESDNPEILWRLAQCGYKLVLSMERKDPARKSLALESHRFATSAFALNPTDFNVVKCAAATAGTVCEVSGNKERIKMGFEFKKYLDEALSMNGKDASLLHMRGRFSFAVSNLSRFERMAASVLFSAPPTATVDEALVDFLEVEKLRPNQWIENLQYTGLCYVAKKDYANARIFLQRAVELKPVDPTDEEAIKEAKKTLKSFPK